MKRVAFVLVGTLIALWPGMKPGQAAGPAAPTFAKDVAPILYEKCASCHRTGEVAPMALLTYEDVRPWAKAIKSKVVAREMPPWGADHEQSLPMRNDRSLSERQIQTIAAWVDGGALKGNDADLPKPPTFTDGWTYGRGEPDYVIEMPTTFDIPAEGELPVTNFYVKVPWNEDRFAEVVELRPGNRAVVHHAGVYFNDLPAGVGITKCARSSVSPARPSCSPTCPDAASMSIVPTRASAFLPASTSAS